MQENKIPKVFASGLSGVDGAAGVPKTKWFVAIVNNRSEKATSEKLDDMGVESYVPIQRVVRVWKNGRKAKVDKVVIPAVLFIHCTEAKRRQLVTLPFIFRFMVNRAGNSGSTNKSLAVVSDDEINRLKFMLGQSDIPVEIGAQTYRKGDRVKVIRGPLSGLEGEVMGMNSAQSELTVSLECIGCARLIIDTVNLELIKNQ